MYLQHTECTVGLWLEEVALSRCHCHWQHYKPLIPYSRCMGLFVGEDRGNGIYSTAEAILRTGDVSIAVQWEIMRHVGCGGRFLDRVSGSVNSRECTKLCEDQECGIKRKGDKCKHSINDGVVTRPPHPRSRTPTGTRSATHDSVLFQTALLPSSCQNFQFSLNCTPSKIVANELRRRRFVLEKFGSKGRRMRLVTVLKHMFWYPTLTLELTHGWIASSSDLILYPGVGGVNTIPSGHCVNNWLDTNPVA